MNTELLLCIASLSGFFVGLALGVMTRSKQQPPKEVVRYVYEPCRFRESPPLSCGTTASVQIFGTKTPPP